MSTDRQAKLSYPFNPIRKSFNTFKKKGKIKQQQQQEIRKEISQL